jgi:hypothetical protein
VAEVLEPTPFPGTWIVVTTLFLDSRNCTAHLVTMRCKGISLQNWYLTLWPPRNQEKTTRVQLGDWIYLGYVLINITNRCMCVSLCIYTHIFTYNLYIYSDHIS